MLWDIYTRSAGQALSSHQFEQAAHLFQLAQGEIPVEEEDSLAPESDLGLALCALKTQEESQVLYHLQNCRSRVQRCLPQQPQLCADRLADLVHASRPQPEAHRAALDILHLLPETPESYRSPEWWQARCEQARENPEEEVWLEELALGLRCGWTLPIDQLETTIRALARFRRQRSEAAPLTGLVELVREQARQLEPAPAIRLLARFAQVFLSDGLPALADLLWLQVLQRGALGAARTSKFLSRRLEKTNLASTSQVLLQGLDLFSAEQRARVLRAWSRFWLAQPGPRLYPLALAADLPADLRVAVAGRAAREDSWELAARALQGLDLAWLETPQERLSVLNQMLEVACHRPGLSTAALLEQKLQLLEQLGERDALTPTRLELVRQCPPARAENLLREILRELGERTVSWPAVECWLLLARASHEQDQLVAARARAERASAWAAQVEGESPTLLSELQELLAALELPPVERSQTLFLGPADTPEPAAPHPVLRARSLIEQGMSCLQKGEEARPALEEADDLLHQALGREQLPESASLALGLSLLALQADKKDQALRHFQPAATYTGEFSDFESGLYHYLGGQLEPESGLHELLEAESVWTRLGEPTPPLLSSLRRDLAERARELPDLGPLEPALLRLRAELHSDEQRQSVGQLLMRATSDPERILDYARASPDLDADSLQRAARACEQLEQYADASDYCRRWAAVQPDERRQTLEKAAHFLEWAGQPEQALELLDQLLEQPGEDPEVRLQRAFELRQQGRWELSQYVLRKRPDPQLQAENALSLERPAEALNGPPWLQFQAAVALGDLARASDCLEKLEGDSQRKLAELQILCLRQEWKAASQLADSLGQEWLDDPLLPQLWRVRAGLRRAQDDFLGARADTTLAWQIKPADGDVWNLANDCVRLCDYAAAEGHLRPLLAQHSQALGPLHLFTLRTQLLLGQVLHSLERLSEARELLTQTERAARRGPVEIHLQAHCELAFLALKTSQWAEAERHFRQASGLPPTPARVRGHSRALAALGRLSEGQEIYRQAPDLKLDFADYLIWHQQSELAWPLLEGSDALALVGRVRILLGKGSREQAEQLYDQIQVSDWNLLAVAVVGAELAAAYHFTAQAAEQFQRALEGAAEPDLYEQVRAQLGQGRALMALGQFQQAVRSLQRASFLLAKEPCWMQAEVLLALGQALRRVGQRSAAEAALQAALEGSVATAPSGSQRLLKFYHALGEHWLEQGQEARAREALEKGLQLGVDRNGAEARPLLSLLQRIDKPTPRTSAPSPAPAVRAPGPRPLRAPAPAPIVAPATAKKKFKRPSQRELVVFGRQFHALLQSGVPITRALASCQQPGSRLTPVLEEVESRVLGGNSMSSSIAEYPEVFGRELSCMFLVAEQSGRLLGVLQRWADDLETREQRRLQLQSALFYPLLVLLTCVAAISALMIVFVPLVRETLVQNNVSPPLPTLILLSLSDWLRSPRLWLAAALMLALGWQILKKVDPGLHSGKRRAQELILKMPVLGRLYQLSLFSGYFHSFATLVESGVRLDLAIEMGGSAISHRGIQGQLKECRKNLLDGDDVGQAFEKIKSAPAFAFQFVAIGMEAGKLPQMCRVVSHTLDMDFELASHALKSVIEPTIMMLAGVATAFVVWAAISPTVSLINSL